ncbi:MAG: NfeD family protein [Hyphomicrobiaceae bacterium]|nr:NfeD family protein [Hyphomicrobiaceae bacterium]
MENSYFVSLGAWNWFILAAILGVLELTLPGFLLIWFGVAALLIGALALAINMVWQLQLVLFALIGIGLLMASKRFAGSKSGKTDRPLLNKRAHTHLGKVYQLVTPTSHGRGSIKVGDSIWQVQLEGDEDLEKGAGVLITDVAGTRLIGRAH